MHAVIMLSDGTKLQTEENVNSDDVLGRLSRATAGGFVGISTADGHTYRVNPAHVVYVRDAPTTEPLVEFG